MSLTASALLSEPTLRSRRMSKNGLRRLERLTARQRLKAADGYGPGGERFTQLNVLVSCLRQTCTAIR